jgi:hypothetical protein
MYILEKKFPKLVEQKKDQLESLLLDNMPLMFKILTALDILDVCTRIRTLFDTVITSYNIEILKKIELLAIQADKKVLYNMERILDGRIKSINDIEFPIYEIMMDMYKDYLVKDLPDLINIVNTNKTIPVILLNDENNDSITGKPFDDTKSDEEYPLRIIDAYNYSNELKYSLSDIKGSKYPPWIDFNIEKKLRLDMNIKEDKIITEWEKYVNEPEVDSFTPLLRKYKNEYSEIGNSTSWLV